MTFEIIEENDNDEEKCLFWLPDGVNRCQSIATQRILFDNGNDLATLCDSHAKRYAGKFRTTSLSDRKRGHSL